MKQVVEEPAINGKKYAKKLTSFTRGFFFFFLIANKKLSLFNEGVSCRGGKVTASNNC